MANRSIDGFELIDPHLDEEEQAWMRQVRAEAEARAEREPGFDFFKELREKQLLLKPKLEIGDYVARQGFSVPMIRSQAEWEEAFDAGQAMLRSELAQDYDGFSGIYSSTTLGPAEYLAELEVQLQFDTGGDFFAGVDLSKRFAGLYNEGLRNGTIDFRSFMKLAHWSQQEKRLQEQTSELGIWLPFGFADISRWRHISGDNIRMFRDPAVDGRYHVGINPKDAYEGAFQFDREHHGEVIQYEGMDRPVPVEELIEFYERIRMLPRFDARQVPLLELQYDTEGQIHFLQYRRTENTLEPVEAFTLPEIPDGIKAQDVRGATVPEGETVRIYINPQHATERMRGQGVFMPGRNFGRFHDEFFSEFSRVFIHEDGLSLRGNHWSAEPMIRPPVAMSLWKCEGEERGSQLSELAESIGQLGGRSVRFTNHVYVEARVTSNGRAATIESDWELHYD